MGYVFPKEEISVSEDGLLNRGLSFGYKEALPRDCKGEELEKIGQIINPYNPPHFLFFFISTSISSSKRTFPRRICSADGRG